MQQMAQYFHRYVGGVSITKGQDALQAWISQLIERGREAQALTGSISSTTRRTSQPEQQGRVGICQPLKSMLCTPNSTFSGPMSSEAGSAAALNSIGLQRNALINYTATHSGPPHDPTWIVRCYGKCFPPVIEWA